MATTVSQTNPQQYIQDLLTQKDSGLFPQLSASLDNQFQQYDGPRIAGFSADQLDAFDRARASTGATDPQEQRSSDLMNMSFDRLFSGGDRTQNFIDQGVSSGSDFLNRALSNADRMSGQGNAFLPEAAGMIRQSGQAPSESDIAQFSNPFQSSVIDTTMQELNRQNNIAQTGRDAQAVGAGAFGGSRRGVVDAEAARGFQDVQARTLAQLNSQNYGQALGAAQNQNQLLGAAGGNLASIGASDFGLRQSANNQLMAGGSNLGNLFSNAASQQGGLTGQLSGGLSDLATRQLGLGSFMREQDMNDINNLYSMGSRQQAQEQGGVDIAYQNFLNERQYEDPRARVSFMGDIIRGAPSGSQTQSRTYEDPMSPLQAILGIGSMAAGFM
jgi:hypothetical protein